MSLQVFVNGLELVNGPIHRLNIRETEGLWDPAALVDPDTVDTFEGPFRVRQTTVDYGLREITIVGSLYIASVSYADKLRALDWLQGVYAPRPSRVVVGSMEFLVDFGRVQIQADELKRLTGTIRYEISGTAVPATLSSSVSAGTGYVQGLAVDTARVNEAATLATMASGVGTITVLGDAPTPAVVTIQGAVSTTYYLATSATGRRVPITTDANGVGRIDERSGFYLVPGVNRITAYAAVTGTTTLTTITVMSLFGTTWRFTGNAPAGNVTRYDLGPALTTNRTGSARYFLGNTNPTAGGTNGIVVAGDDEPRIGWVWQNRWNILVNSVDLRANWTDNSLTLRQGGLPDAFGYETGGRAGLLASDTTIVNLANNQYVLGSLSAISYTASVYILKDSVTSRQAGFFVQISGGNFIAALLNTSTGVAQKSSNSLLAGTVSVTDEGIWWRLSATWTGDGTSNVFNLCPAIAVSGGTVTTATATGSAVFACPQVELGTTATAYQATDASGIAIDHPANDAGLVLEGQASNLCLQSQDINNATWTKNNLTSPSTTNVAPDGTSTAYQAESNGASSNVNELVSGLTAASTYTFSVWIRKITGTDSVNIYMIDGGSQSMTACTVGTNWSRFSVTRTMVGTSAFLQIGGDSTWSTGEVLQIWGAQLELGTAATSYIPTTTVSARREADICGVLNPHNLALQSETQTNAAWSLTGWTIASTPIAGPVASLLNAYRITTTGTSTDNIRQTVPITGGSALKAYTFSVWLRQNATTASVSLHIENSSGTSRGNATATLSTTWQRFVVTTAMVAGDTDLIIKIRTANPAGTIDVFGAQVTEGYLPGRYVRTTDTQVVPTTAIDPSWSQNGYIEFDAIWAPRASGIGHFFGDSAATTAATQIGILRFQTDNSGPSVVFARFDSSGTQRTTLLTSSTVYNRGYAKIRGEWLNYTLAGTRYMLIRCYVDGSLAQELNVAGTAGTSWPTVDVSRLSRMAQTTSALGSQGTISNLTLGVPLLPQGAVPAGI